MPVKSPQWIQIKVQTWMSRAQAICLLYAPVFQSCPFWNSSITSFIWQLMDLVGGFNKRQRLWKWQKDEKETTNSMYYLYQKKNKMFSMSLKISGNQPIYNVNVFGVIQASSYCSLEQQFVNMLQVKATEYAVLRMLKKYME